MLRTEEIKEDYTSIKKAAYHLYQSEKFDQSLKLIVAASAIAYEYNFIDSFYDDDLDDLLNKISIVYFEKDINYVSYSNRVIFYDYFCFINRGLTRQYLDALIDLKFEILYVVENDKTLSHDNDIINLFKEYPLGRLLVLSNGLNSYQKADKILQAIKVFRPSKAFLHLSPWDVVASLVFSRLNSVLHRYFINLTDHAFWLGRNLIDTCLEFRNFGYQLSKECRRIDSNKLKLLPYYPVVQNENKFLGIPIKTDGKVIGISGGNGYKFLGDNGRFYKWIKGLLEKHKDFCFLLVGTGAASSFFLAKIIEDNLQDRFALIDDRPDIFQLLKNCDIYIGSYPFLGGLMSQLAVMAGLPLICFTKAEYTFNYIEDLFIRPSNTLKTFTNENEFLNTISNLINNKELRKNFIKEEKNIITKEAFVSSIASILGGGLCTISYESYSIPNIEDSAYNMSNLFLEIENNFNSKYCALVESKVGSDIKSIDNDRLKERLKTFSQKRFLERLRNHPEIIFKSIIRSIIKWIPLNKTLKKVYYKLINKKEPILSFKNGVPVSTLQIPNHIVNPKYIEVGKNFGSFYGLRIEAIDNYLGQRFLPEVIIGDNVNVNPDCHIGCINKVIIGNNVLIASKVYISDHSHGHIDKDELIIAPKDRLLFSKGPVIIKDNVWIGENVCIFPNVIIGKNSIIGANAVVNKDVPENAVVAGIPAKVIKILF